MKPWLMFFAGATVATGYWIRVLRTQECIARMRQAFAVDRAVIELGRDFAQIYEARR